MNDQNGKSLPDTTLRNKKLLVDGAVNAAWDAAGTA